MADQLDVDLEAAVSEELEQPINDLNQLAGAPGMPMPKVRPFRVKDLPKEESRPERGNDQLAMAVKGMLQVEDEFRKLASELVGELKLEETDKLVPSENGPVLARLRSDAEMLARLAIRMHRLIEEVRSKL